MLGIALRVSCFDTTVREYGVPWRGWRSIARSAQFVALSGSQNEANAPPGEKEIAEELNNNHQWRKTQNVIWKSSCDRDGMTARAVISLLAREGSLTFW